MRYNPKLGPFPPPPAHLHGPALFEAWTRPRVRLGFMVLAAMVAIEGAPEDAIDIFMSWEASMRSGA